MIARAGGRCLLSLAALDGKFDSVSQKLEVETDDLTTMPHFNVFISHKRTDAQDFARSLYSLLTAQDYSCFLDVEALETISDLPLIFIASMPLACWRFSAGCGSSMVCVEHSTHVAHLEYVACTTHTTSVTYMAQGAYHT